MTTSTFPIRNQGRSSGVVFFTLWLSRTVLFLPMIVMILIGARYVADPVHAASPSGVMLTTPEALTDTRVVGAIAFTVAFVIAISILSNRRLRMGHSIVVALMGFILAVRIFGFLHDGTTLSMGDQKFKTIGEVVFLSLNGIALAMQSRLRRESEARS